MGVSPVITRQILKIYDPFISRIICKAKPHRDRVGRLKTGFAHELKPLAIGISIVERVEAWRRQTSAVVCERCGSNGVVESAVELIRMNQILRPPA